MQFIEIAKSLDSATTELIIFDEPTAVLTESESNTLLEIIEQLPSKGISCVFISHKLEEVLQISDKIVVLRDGAVVRQFARGETNAQEIAKVMVGREISREQAEPRDFSGKPVVLSVKNLTVKMPGETVKDVSFEVHDGEIFGICGLAGSGKLGISNGIHGLYPAEGEVAYKGELLDIHEPKKVLEKGIAFMSEDRKKVGLMLEESIEMNCTLASHVITGRFSKRVLGVQTMNRRACREATDEMIEALRIKCTSPQQQVGALSGGNQQKVCVASVLLQKPQMVFVSEPSRGVDIGAKKNILDYFRKLNREDNITIVLTSSELNELRLLCDRIAVIAEGRLVGILNANEPASEFGILMTNTKR